MILARVNDTADNVRAIPLNRIIQCHNQKGVALSEHSISATIYVTLFLIHRNIATI